MANGGPRVQQFGNLVGDVNALSLFTSEQVSKECMAACGNELELILPY